MSVTIVTVPTFIIDDLTPGASKNFIVTVEAIQPPSTVVGTVTAEFNGESASAPVNVNYNTPPILPTLVVDLGGATNLTASVGTATPKAGSPNQWNIVVTVTAV